MDIASGTYAWLSKCCQKLISPIVQGDKTPRPSSGSLSSSAKQTWKRDCEFALAAQGAVADPNLPQETKEQIQSLIVALWESTDVRQALEKGGSVQELEALMHSSEEALDELTNIACFKEELINQVAVVYADMHTALSHCAAKELAKQIFVTSKQGDLRAIDALYGNNQWSLVLMVLTSVKALRHAVKAALSKQQAT